MTTLPPLVLAAAAAVALALPLLGWAVLVRPDPAVLQTRDNLARGLELTGPGRSARSGAAAGVGLVRALTPRGTVARLNRLAGTAGRPAAWPVPRLVAAKLVLAAIGAGLTLLLFLSTPGVRTALLGLGVTGVAYMEIGRAHV